jgi:hypothetical protein
VADADAALIAADTAHLTRDPMDLLIAYTGLSLSKADDLSDLFGEEPEAA